MEPCIFVGNFIVLFGGGFCILYNFER